MFDDNIGDWYCERTVAHSEGMGLEWVRGVEKLGRSMSQQHLEKKKYKTIIFLES